MFYKYHYKKNSQQLQANEITNIKKDYIPDQVEFIPAKQS